jgi:hypothetical protein
MDKDDECDNDVASAQYTFGLTDRYRQVFELEPPAGQANQVQHLSASVLQTEER